MVFRMILNSKDKTACKSREGEKEDRRQENCFICTFKSTFLYFLNIKLYFHLALAATDFIASLVCVCSAEKVGERRHLGKPSAWCEIWFGLICTITSDWMREFYWASYLNHSSVSDWWSLVDTLCPSCKGSEDFAFCFYIVLATLCFLAWSWGLSTPRK